MSRSNAAVSQRGKVIQPCVHGVCEIHCNCGNISVLHRHIQKNNAVCQGAEPGNFFAAEFPHANQRVYVFQCVHEAYIQEESFTTESGYRMMNRLLEQETLPTAVIASSDPIAIGALHALNDKGFRVPDDISLVGFDDTSLSAFTAPPLTTVHAPAYDMGNFGANIVFHILKQQPATAMKIQLPCRLVERQSCKKLQGTV